MTEPHHLQSVRAANLNNQKLAFHLARVHLGISEGTLNYYSDAIEIYDQP